MTDKMHNWCAVSTQVQKLLTDGTDDSLTTSLDVWSRWWSAVAGWRELPADPASG